MLTIITASNDDASKVYVKKKLERAELEGITCNHVDVSTEGTSFEVHIRLLAVLRRWANDPVCDGILLQLPLTDKLLNAPQSYIDEIPPEKDVDCLTTINQGAIMLGSDYLPCTSHAVLDLIKVNEDNDLRGVCVHVVGWSTLVTKPLVVALGNAGATVRMWRSGNTKEEIEEAVGRDTEHFDKVHFVSGIGQAQYFTFDGNLRKERLYVYDIGMNRDENGKLCGDVKHDCGAAYQSVVPGGVGPLTVEYVFKNYRELLSVKS